MRKIQKSAFTLVEIMVSLVIFAIIMVSVMTIYIQSAQISTNADMNRIMQENIKNTVEQISEDVRKN
jgi:prepilin-type N-terminal cleavage/methylation domain-containing protein